ncbi:MAG: phytoene desaturase, partial [Sphingobacteriia bacterium]
VYINITSKCEPGLAAPIGKENWFVMVNAPAHQGQDWEALVPAYRALILEKLQTQLGEDLAPFIEEEAILTPAGIAHKTLSHSGSLYGTSSNNRMAAFLRHPNQAPSPKGLYFVGGSVHPGGGIPLCLSSARIMAQSIPSPSL